MGEEGLWLVLQEDLPDLKTVSALARVLCDTLQPLLGEVDGVASFVVPGGLIEHLLVCQYADLFDGPGAVLRLDLFVLVGLAVARGRDVWDGVRGFSLVA